MSANDLTLQYGKAGVLNAGSVARAVDIYEIMIEEDATILGCTCKNHRFRNVIVESIIKMRIAQRLMISLLINPALGLDSCS